MFSECLWLEDEMNVLNLTNLSSNRDLFEVLISSRAFGTVGIVKNYSDASFRHSSLTTFINKILLVRSTHLCSMGRVLASCTKPLRGNGSRTVDMLVIPRTKHIASRMLDLPEPFNPVMALNEASQPVICVRTGYDLKPRITSD